ncbi:MAG: hypothetical protein ABWY25_05585 [Paenisporosarcina sp.]
MAAILATGLLALNLSIVANAEALGEPDEVFCLKYPEFCVVDENIQSGVTTCPAGTALEGHVVLEENAPLVCDIGIPQLFTCPTSTNLAGALVTDLVICDLD